VTRRKPDTPLRFEVAPGSVVAHNARTVLILETISSSQVRVRDVASGSEETVPVSELSGIAGGLSRRDVLNRWEQVRSTTRDEWLHARRRERVIRRVIGDEGAVETKVASACRALGVSRPTIFRMLQRYRQAGQTSSLLVGHSGTPQQYRRLSKSRESIVTRAIEEKFLSRPRVTVSQLTEEIRNRCLRASLKPVSRRAIEMRIAQLDPRVVKRGRHGSKAAHDAFGPVGGTYDVTEPLAVMQIDHTPVDAMVVDPLTRKAIARPWLTLAIDVATRMVMGMSVCLEAPSIHSVSLALTHACLPKDRWIADRGLDLSWETLGLPKALHMDNAREFKSEAIRRGCDEYGIKKIFRPVARPHFGGHIERLIGTLMGRVHLLAGTTGSNVAERGDYDSAKSATMTLAEFEAWLALEIAGRYHRQTHRALGISPLAAWEAALKRAGSLAPGRCPAIFPCISAHGNAQPTQGWHPSFQHPVLVGTAALSSPAQARIWWCAMTRAISRVFTFLAATASITTSSMPMCAIHRSVSGSSASRARACARNNDASMKRVFLSSWISSKQSSEAARATRTARQRGPTALSQAAHVDSVNYDLPTQDLEGEMLGSRR
jgi:transposase InsO family protein